MAGEPVRRFAEVAGQIRDGDLIAFSGRAWISMAIRWSTDSDLSHLGLAVWVKFAAENRYHLCCIESTKPYGVRILPLYLLLEDCAAENARVYWQPLRDPSVSGKDVVREAIALWGKNYPPTSQLVLAGFRHVRWLYERLFGEVDRYPDSYHCSELVGAALEGAGVRLDRTPALCSPSYLSGLPVWGERTEVTL